MKQVTQHFRTGKLAVQELPTAGCGCSSHPGVIDQPGTEKVEVSQATGSPAPARVGRITPSKTSSPRTCAFPDRLDDEDASFITLGAITLQGVRQ